MRWFKGMLGGRPTAEADEWVSRDWDAADEPPARPAGFADAMAAFEAGAAALLGRPLPPPDPPAPSVQPAAPRRPRQADAGVTSQPRRMQTGGAPPDAPEAVAEHRPSGVPEARARDGSAARGTLDHHGAAAAQAAGPRGPGRPAPEEMPPFPSTGPHGHRGRMRDKLLERGADALADYELLEMLLFFAFKTGDTKPLAKELINRYGSFAAVLAAPPRELLEARGLGPHSVSAIKLVQASALRLAKAEVMERPVLNNWDRLSDYLTAALARERVEQFRVLFLDPRNRLLADEAQGKGTVNHTPVYPREVVKRALEVGATALILVHNHPSGDPTPSRADVEMTAEVKAAAGVFGIAVHDHLIVGNGRQTSLRREGLL
ncbi:hypothetical protein GCM10009416_39440 [Craurococcus roseus]|uniref:MPN domain-containing protein n=2 Tax=Craurococcus roseus TaxID=77585 RepID=A0ABP3QXI8_9PROT